MADDIVAVTRAEWHGEARDLIELATSERTVAELLRRGLEWLTRVVRFDLATLFLLREGKLVSVVARGPLASERVRRHELRLADFPSLRQALETRRARAFTSEDHSHGDGDPFDGVLDLPPGHACMVVPLCAAERCYGVLTLDRTECETYPREVVDLVEVYGQMLATSLQEAEQKSNFERLHRREHAHARLLESQLGGDEVGVLETSRAAPVRELALRARQVAETDTPVLLLGETGTGKERLARAVHRWSARAEGAFVTLNCAAIPAGLLESELFGHVKGSFTGATRDRAGRFQMAHGGTLFLDEVGELPVELQAKLLRALQEKTFEPVGSDKTVRADVRILAATHVDLQEAIRQRRFREDLYYRLSVFPLRLPPLRERLEDLPLLCAFLLEEQSRRTGRKGMEVTADGLARLAAYDWPGNIRELANALERATILSRRPELGAESFDVPVRLSSPVRSAPVPLSLAEGAVPTLEEVQRQHILRVLGLTQGRLYGPGGAAALLGLKPSTLQSRMKKLGITRLEQYVATPPPPSGK
ncbi:sigma 54-interacting transcriptional regulator [Melittangium boletus]|uniref:Formate hydrogenlyase transcriptional activator n=1 Tax=Melittangium boletus DSM 14713 TaxID=1294270 RepID=A0A250IKC8_9BACT|nr:sigma 54-interacting transcriptional regulator [Melittangium boletus]ATB31672.1 formate hydrogenlyase transcriptional activator [Melittangium boletus DSM 14713]